MSRNISKSGEAREINIPSEVIGKDGNLLVQFRNLTIGQKNAAEPERRVGHAVAFSLKTGVELLAPSGTFFGNILRGALLMLIRLAMIAIIGVAANTILHFPVAVLLLIAVISYGYGKSFMDKQIDKAFTPSAKEVREMTQDPSKKMELTGPAYWLKKTFIQPILKIAIKIPANFSDTDPIPDYVDGRTVSFNRIGIAAFWYLLIRGGIAFGLGALCFYRREIDSPDM
jgi:hypothetical protein